MLTVFTNLQHRDIKQPKIIGFWKMTSCNLIKVISVVGETGMSIFTSSILNIQTPSSSKMLLVLDQATQYHIVDFDVLLTMHLSIFILIINQLDAQSFFDNKFHFMPLHVSSTMCSSSGGQNCIIQPLVSSHL